MSESVKARPRIKGILIWFLLLFAILEGPNETIFCGASEGGGNEIEDNSFLPLSHASGVYDRMKKAINILAKRISTESINVTGKTLEQLECSEYQRYCTVGNDSLNQPSLNPDDHYADKCSCSSDCYEYGDCCWDVPSPVDPEEESTEDYSVRTPLFTCADIDNPGFQSVLIVSRCPEEWIIEDVKDQCEFSRNNQEQSTTDPFLNLLVSSAQNNLTYRNVFCAACNGQKKLIPWQVIFHCPTSDEISKSIETNVTLNPEESFQTSNEQRNASESSIEYSETNETETETLRTSKAVKIDLKIENNLQTSTEMMTTIDNSQFSKNCPVSFRYPNDPSTLNLKPCNNFFKSKCKPGVRKNSEYQAKMCSLYYAPVSDDPLMPTYYKNKFCAFCNGVRARKLICDQPTVHSMYGTRKTIQHLIPSAKITPYSVLLDIDFINGGSVVGTTRSCPIGDVYDPWSQRCRSVICGENYIYSEGLCISNLTQEVDFVSGDKPSSTYNACPKMLTTEAYHLDENATLVFEHRDFTLEKGQYQIRDNETVMICILTDVYVTKFGENQGILTIVCVTISLISLFLKIVLHFVMPNPKKVAPNAIASLSVSIFVAQLLFLTGAPRTEWNVYCIIIGLLIHYFFLASFFWSNILAYDIWRTFSCIRTPKSPSSNCSEVRKKFLYYSLYGWLSPFLVVSVAVLLDFAPIHLDEWRPHYGEQICWLSNRRALLAFFAAPLAALLLFNLCFFVCTAFKIAKALRASRFVHENTGKQDCIRFGLYMKLALIMGLAWTFGFVAPGSNSDVFWYLYILLNGLQGAFIFLAFTDFKRFWQILKCTKKSGTSGATVDSRTSQSSRTNLATSMTNITNITNL